MHYIKFEKLVGIFHQRPVTQVRLPNGILRFTLFKLFPDAPVISKNLPFFANLLFCGTLILNLFERYFPVILFLFSLISLQDPCNYLTTIITCLRSKINNMICIFHSFCVMLYYYNCIPRSLNLLTHLLILHYLFDEVRLTVHQNIQNTS